MTSRTFKTFFALLLMLLTFSLYNLKSSPLNDEIKNRTSVFNFKEVRLFDFITSKLKQKNLENEHLNGTLLKLNVSNKQSLQQTQDENILLKIPLSEHEYIELELIKSKVMSEDFKTATISENGEIKTVPYEPGLYYRGVLKGDSKSWAAVSIFDEYIAIVIASSGGNYNIGPLKNKNKAGIDEYIFFNDIDVPVRNNFRCLVQDSNPEGNKNENNILYQFGYDALQYPIKEYFECDYKMYQDFGSSTTRVNNFLSAIFNSIIAVYQAEQINIVLQSVYVWTVPDIYTNTNSLPVMIKRFGARIRNNFNGHLGTLVSTRTNTGGGYAWVDVLCINYSQSDSSGPYAVCIIDTNYHPYPVYSWVINVLTHEIGHNVGSKHTHNCFWPGGPIDTCYYVEGGCYNGPLKPRIGTIMSYCHINGGVNLALGFGPLPGNYIRQRYNNAPCLIGIKQISSQVPQQFELSQNYPNPFNPQTIIKFSVAVKSKVKLIIYDAIGREVDLLVDEWLEPGFYEAEYNTNKLSSGVYYYKFFTNDFSKTKKMVLIK